MSIMPGIFNKLAVKDKVKGIDCCGIIGHFNIIKQLL